MTPGDRTLVASVGVLLFLLWLLLTLIGQPAFPAERTKPVEIRLNPQVVMKGGALWLTCRVEPNEHNRAIILGIQDYQESERPLHGVDGPVTTRLLFQQIPCDVSRAYCVVGRNDAERPTASSQLVVAGCD